MRFSFRVMQLVMLRVRMQLFSCSFIVHTCSFIVMFPFCDSVLLSAVLRVQVPEKRAKYGLGPCGEAMFPHDMTHM